MILYANGCSWTWGGGLEPYFKFDNVIHDDQRLKLVWPHHLGKYLKAKRVDNLALGAGSNQRLVRTTYDYLISKSKQELEETVAVIQFSEWTRFERYIILDHNNYMENDPNRWVRCKVDTVLFEGSDYNITDKDVIEEEFEDTKRRLSKITRIENFYNTVAQLHALKSMFISFGVKDFYFWHLGHGWIEFPLEMRLPLYKQFNILDEVHDVNLCNWNLSHPDYWQYERLVPNSYVHPSLKGHEELAVRVLNKMFKKGFKL